MGLVAHCLGAGGGSGSTGFSLVSGVKGVAVPNSPVSTSPTEALLTFGSSSLILAGLLGIAPLFRSKARQAEDLRKAQGELEQRVRDRTAEPRGGQRGATAGALLARHADELLAAQHLLQRRAKPLHPH